MGTIKIEFDCPDFKEELNINIVIRKDGEVVKVENKSTFATPPLNPDNRVQQSLEVSTVDKKASSKKKDSSETTTKKRSGNMMGLEL